MTAIAQNARRLEELREDLGRTDAKIAQCLAHENELRSGRTSDLRVEAALANLAADRTLYENARANLRKEISELEHGE